MRFKLPRRVSGSQIREVFEKAEDNSILENSKAFVLDLGRTLDGEVTSIQAGINQHIDSPGGEFWVQYMFRSLCNKPIWYQKKLALDREYSYLSLTVYVRNKTLIPDEVIKISSKNHKLHKYIAPYIEEIEEFFARELC